VINGVAGNLLSDTSFRAAANDVKLTMVKRTHRSYCDGRATYLKTLKPVTSASSERKQTARAEILRNVARGVGFKTGYPGPASEKAPLNVKIAAAGRATWYMEELRRVAAANDPNELGNVAISMAAEEAVRVCGMYILLFIYLFGSHTNVWFWLHR
jgi:hypothetical protein